ncbi:acyltransferase [Brevibacterium samyangense]|uniref:Acyltransferase family protein n=1 Tax=Brevibacterium samyangense TaxID=366888 RepID=A0ABP5ER49_9MICO
MALSDRIGDENPPPTSTRWMNPARSLAIIVVVAIHAIADTVETRFTDFGTSAWWLANFIDSASRWCVPVFLMISGALALDPRRGVTPGEFWAKRVWRIGIPLVFWTVVYVLFRLYYMHGRKSDWNPILAIASGSPFVQLYFLYVIGGLALLTPWMRLLAIHGSRRLQWGTALILLGIGMVDLLLSRVFGVGELNAATRFFPLMAFYVLGWVLRDWILTRRQLAWTWVVFLGSWLVTFGWAGLGIGEKPWKFSYEYLSPGVVGMSLSAYLLLHWYMREGAGTKGAAPGAPRLPRWRALHLLYPYSFGVFLLHPLLLFPMRNLIGVPSSLGDVALHGIVMPIVYTVVCALATWVCLRIPLLRDVFGSGNPPQIVLQKARHEN